MSRIADLARRVTGNTDKAKRPLSLANYVQTRKRVKLDRWQEDMCRRLEEAFRKEGRRITENLDFGKTR